MVAPTHAIRQECNLLTVWASPKEEGRESLYNLTLRKIPLSRISRHVLPSSAITFAPY